MNPAALRQVLCELILAHADTADLVVWAAMSSGTTTEDVLGRLVNAYFSGGGFDVDAYRPRCGRCGALGEGPASHH